ncbi:MAG TPA: hypothetical protein VFF69_13780 [Phycisphaerales bacterium]|nr:hypothetical protein [Phycisphaerales bacterium]
MKPTHKLLLLVPAILLFAGMGAMTYYMKFLRYKDKLESDLATYSSAIEGFKAALDERSTTEQKLLEVAQSTLGFTPDQVDSRFRDGLQRLARDAGLIVDEIVVTTQAGKPIKNPAVDQKVSEFRTVARSESIAMSDVYMVDAEVRGGGSFAAVTRLLALAQSQPWIWSVRGFSLKPRDAQAAAFDIRLDVCTAFMPDLAPPAASGAPATPDSQPPVIVDPTAEQVLASGTIVSRNVFAPPPLPQSEPVTIAAATPQPVGNAPNSSTPPPPPPPYHEWRLTSISSSPAQGSMAIMLNDRTGGALFLSPGQAVLDAVLVLAVQDKAVFQIGERKFSLALDQTLADRHPLE